MARIPSVFRTSTSGFAPRLTVKVDRPINQKIFVDHGKNDQKHGRADLLFTYHGRHQFEDVYYDIRRPAGSSDPSSVPLHRTLASQGIYLRRRNGIWELKRRVWDGFAKSSFVDLAGTEAIREEIRQLGSLWKIDLCDRSAKADGLVEVARVSTTRVVFKAEEAVQQPPAGSVCRFVVDETSFGHVTGKIQLKKELGTYESRSLRQKHAELLADQLETALDGMLDRFRELVQDFDDKCNATYVSKLSAYFARELEHDTPGASDPLRNSRQ